eukprot:scaffold19638_cov68-Phaeocystis_antarctica.AAC.6
MLNLRLTSTVLPLTSPRQGKNTDRVDTVAQISLQASRQRHARLLRLRPAEAARERLRTARQGRWERQRFQRPNTARPFCAAPSGCDPSYRQLSCSVPSVAAAVSAAWAPAPGPPLLRPDCEKVPYSGCGHGGWSGGARAALRTGPWHVVIRSGWLAEHSAGEQKPPVDSSVGRSV